MGQLAKCAEAQALRKAWPEIGQQPVYEEMAGKVEKDITPTDNHKLLSQAVNNEPEPEPKQELVEPEAISKEDGDDLYNLIEVAQSDAEVTAVYQLVIERCQGKANKDALAYFIELCKGRKEQLKHGD